MKYSQKLHIPPEQPTIMSMEMLVHTLSKMPQLSMCILHYAIGIDGISGLSSDQCVKKWFLCLTGQREEF